MFMNRFLKYLVTEKGRQFTMHAVAATSITMFCVNYIPNTILVEKFKSIVQGYKQGEEREVPEKLHRRFEYAMDLCKCTDFEKKFVHPFIAFGFDTIQIGSLKSRFGGHVGVPANYLYDKISDIERGEIRARDKEINWSSEDGKMLQNSLVLSEIEQVFAITKSIMLLKTHKLLLTSLYPPLCLLSIYGTAHYLNQKMNLYARPLMVRFGLYTIMATFGYGLYAFLTDFTQVYYETCVDKELAEMGPEMTAAGIRFYDKMLKKNVALRNLTGQNIYTASGNEKAFLRQKSLPLTIRKSFFEMKKKEFDEASPAKLVA